MAPHRLVRLLRPDAGTAARERGVEHARQLRRRADRLPAARRAARLDRRPGGVRAHRRLPVRLRRACSPPGWPTSPPSSETSARCRSTCPGSSCWARPRPAAVWGDAAVVVPWVLYERYGDVGVLRAQYPSMRAWVDQVADLAGERPAVGHRLPVRRLARPGRAAGPAGRRPHRPAPGRHRRTAPAAPARWPGSPRCSGEDGRPPPLRRRSPRRCARRSTTSSSRRAAGWPATRRPRTPLALDRRPAGEGGPARARRAAAGRTGRGRGPPHRHRIRRHAADLRRAHRGRRRRHRVPPAAAARVPVVALPGDHGRHHDLGALGQHAARRLGQPRRDDVVQPLRVRRGRRLAAPHGRRARARPRPATGGSWSGPGPAAGSPHAVGDARQPLRPHPVAWRRRSGRLDVEVHRAAWRHRPRPASGPSFVPVEVGSGRHPFTCSFPRRRRTRGADDPTARR